MSLGLAPARARASSAVSCPPTALLAGPADVVRQVETELRAHGVAVQGQGTCAQHAVRATLAKTEPADAYQVHVEDGYGRVSDRRVVSLALAVSLIESWSLDEDADLLVVSSPHKPSDSRGDELASQFATSSPLLWGGIQGTLGSDGSAAAGGSVAACARVGALCVGVGTRILYDGDLAPVGGRGSATRTTVDVLIAGGVPLAFGRLVVMPSLALGGGWTHTRAVDDDNDATTVSDLALRTELSLLAGIAVTPRVAVALELAASWSPSARASRDVDPGPAGDIPAEPKSSVTAGLVCVVSP